MANQISQIPKKGWLRNRKIKNINESAIYLKKHDKVFNANRSHFDNQMLGEMSHCSADFRKMIEVGAFVGKVLV